jgi:hypothetical protein
MQVTAEDMLALTPDLWQYPDTPRVQDLRRRVRDAMEVTPSYWEAPDGIDKTLMDKPLPVRKAHAIALKLRLMPTELWDGQLFAGSMTLESPRLHFEQSFPDYVTDAERERAAQGGLSIRSCFGHIVPDYPRLLQRGLQGIIDAAQTQRQRASSTMPSGWPSIANRRQARAPIPSAGTSWSRWQPTCASRPATLPTRSGRRCSRCGCST